MSVIVKGMKMPKNCLHCDFDDSYGICACRNEAPYVCEYSAKQRPSWCPLEEVPSAQPETHDKRMETHGVCLDTIDRQLAIDALTRKMVSIPTAGEKDLMGDVNRIRAEDISVIKRLPSAQPQRTGRWIDYHTTCSECGWQMIDDVMESPNIVAFNFCPNCGTDMREDGDANVDANT